MKAFNIVDSFNSEPDVKDLGSGSIAILADDGTRLYDLLLNNDGSLSISSNSTVKFNGVILDTLLQVEPRFSNNVYVRLKPMDKGRIS